MYRHGAILLIVRVCTAWYHQCQRINTHRTHTHTHRTHTHTPHAHTHKHTQRTHTHTHTPHNPVGPRTTAPAHAPPRRPTHDALTHTRLGGPFGFAHDYSSQDPRPSITNLFFSFCFFFYFLFSFFSFLPCFDYSLLFLLLLPFSCKNNVFSPFLGEGAPGEGRGQQKKKRTKKREKKKRKR